MYGFEVFLPQEEEPRPGMNESIGEAIYRIDRKGIEWADAVVANLDGTDPDSGTAWECGYAAGCGKGVLAYRADFRVTREVLDARINVMLDKSVTWLSLVATPQLSIAEVVHTLVEQLCAYRMARKQEEEVNAHAHNHV
jgi:nucleoside 2-deoxyribosyltransferase